MQQKEIGTMFLRLLPLDIQIISENLMANRDKTDVEKWLKNPNVEKLPGL